LSRRVSRGGGWGTAGRAFAAVCLVVLLGYWLLPDATPAAPSELVAVHAAAAGCDGCACSAQPIPAHDRCPSGGAHPCCALPAKVPCLSPLGASEPRRGESERVASRRLTPPLRPPNVRAA